MGLHGLETTDREIARSTGYIKDDKYIASVYGVNVERVKKIRAKEDEKRRLREERPVSTSHSHVISRDGEAEHYKKMARGSELLRDAVIALIAARNGSHAAS